MDLDDAGEGSDAGSPDQEAINLDDNAAGDETKGDFPEQPVPPEQGEPEEGEPAEAANQVLKLKSCQCRTVNMSTLSSSISHEQAFLHCAATTPTCKSFVYFGSTVRLVVVAVDWAPAK